MADLSTNMQQPHRAESRVRHRSKVLADRARQYDSAMQHSMRGVTAQRRASPSAPRHPTTLQQSEIPEEDRSPDGGITSHLGDSYVEDVRTRGGILIDRGKPFVDQSQNEMEGEEAPVDGGLVGLLAQIYDQQRQVL